MIEVKRCFNNGSIEYVYRQLTIRHKPFEKGFWVWLGKENISYTNLRNAKRGIDRYWATLGETENETC